MSLSRQILKVLSTGLIVLGTSTVFGQDFPSKPIRIDIAVVGGGTEFSGRILAQGITGPLGQPVLLDVRGDAVRAAEHTRNSAPDGYTLVMVGGSLWVSPLLQKMPYDPVKDYAPITQITRELNVLVVPTALPVKSVKELIALAKARPGELNYASGPTGTTGHLAHELFNQMAGIKTTRIAYKALATQGVSDLITGQIQLLIIDKSTAMPHVNSGRLKLLAVTTAQPSPLVPGVPTVSESGLPGFESVGIGGIWAPGKTPAAIINRLNREMVRVLNQPDVREKYNSNGVEVVANSPEEFAAWIKSDMDRWEKVIKEAGIKTD